MAKAAAKKEAPAKKPTKKTLVEVDSYLESLSVQKTKAFRMSTGIDILDIGLTGKRDPDNRGIPGGKMTLITGGPANGKSLLALSIAGVCISLGGKVLYGDVEGRLDPSLAALVGLSSDSVYHIIPKSLEKFIEIMSTSLKGKADEQREMIAKGEYPPPFVVVVDSLAVLGSEKEEAESRPLLMAAGWSQFWRGPIKAEIAGLNIYLVFINQIKKDVDFTMSRAPKKDRLPAGSSNVYLSSVHIQATSQKMYVKDGDKFLPSPGEEITYKIERSFGFVPKIHSSVPFYFRSGVDNFGAFYKFITSPEYQSCGLSKLITKDSQGRVTHTNLRDGKGYFLNGAGGWLEHLSANEEELNEFLSDCEDAYIEFCSHDLV